MKKIQQSIFLILFSTTTLLFTIAFAAYKKGSATASAEDWLLAKKAMAVACGVDESQTTPSRNNGRDDAGPVNKGNSCSHQAATGALCKISKSKRRLLKPNIC